MKQWIPGGVKLGCDELRRRIKGKRVALMLNASALDNEGRLLMDVIIEEKWADVAFFIGMEHGVRGDIYAGMPGIGDIDYKTGIRIVNAYACEDYHPPVEEIKKVDAVVFSAQDVGVRHWTYTPWMLMLLESCAKADKEVIILDRPNPLGGEVVEGGCAEPFSIGLLCGFDYPLRHGMTMGEIAMMYNEEKKIGAQLTVIPAEGWSRDLFYDQTGLVWLPPSPNMPTVDTAFYFATTGLLQSSNCAIGIKTTTPFQYIGAPNFNGDAMATELNSLALDGVYFVPKFYMSGLLGTAEQMPQLCNGVMTVIHDRKAFRPVTTQLHIMDMLLRLYPEYVNFEEDKKDARPRMGTHVICDRAARGESLLPVIEDWWAQAEAFNKRRQPWLIYK